MGTFCNLPYQAVGPNSQTLFLGGSVLNFSLNLGWGGESSSCTVKIAKDYSHHPNSSAAFKEFDNRLNYLNQQDKSSTQNRSRAFDSDDLKAPSDPQDPAFLQSNLVVREIEKWKKSVFDDRITLQPFGIKDLGKKCWPSYRDQSNGAIPFNWLNPDPGFIGDPRNFATNTSIDIIGCPAFFRYEDIWFGGMIKNWKYGKGQYEIQLQSFASLLKGCQMVLQKYTGTVTTEIPNTATALVTGQNLSVPYGDVYLATNNQHPYYNPNAFASSPYQGNIPNFFNVFGYAENIYGFGTLKYIEGKGVSAGYVYDAIVEMLNPISFYGENPHRNQTQWNPYGAIIAKTPLDRSNNTMIDPSRIFFQFDRAKRSFMTGTSSGALEKQRVYLADFGLVASPMAIDGLPRSHFRLDLSEVPRPPNGIYLSQDTMDILTFVDYCCSNAGFDFYVDFLPDVQPSWYSGTIKIRTVTRKVQPYPDLVKDFLSSLDNETAKKVVDYNFGEEYNDVKSRSILIGGPQQRLHQFTTHTYGILRQNKIFEPDLAHFTDTTYIQEANQVRGNNLFNTYRAPDHYSQRGFNDSVNGPWKGIPEGAVVAQVDNEFYQSVQNSYGNMLIVRGNYLKNSSPSLSSRIPGSYGQDSYPLYLDCISPYFGVGSDGEVRKVFLDRIQRQLQILFDFRDIQPFFPTAYTISDGSWGTLGQMLKAFAVPGGEVNVGGIGEGGAVGYGKFLVTESELRVAVMPKQQNQGDDGWGEAENWWSYTQYRMKMGYPTAISKILYDYWARAINVPFAALLFDLGDVVGSSNPQGNGMVDKTSWLQYINHVGTYYSGLPNYRGKGRFQFPHKNTLNANQFRTLRSGAIQLIQKIHTFLREVASTHYGKTFSVRVPDISYYNDPSGKTVYSYEITDSAWEEPGNTIDDTIQVGNAIGSTLQTADGRWPAMVGFDNSAEHWHSPYDSQIFYNVQYVIDPSRRTRYTIMTPGYNDPFTAQATTFMKMGMGLLNNRLYHPLKHQLQDCVSLPYAAYTGSVVGPVGTPLFSATPPTVSAHGFPVPPNARYKLYTKANIENIATVREKNQQIVFVDGTPRVVLALQSPVFINTADSPFYNEVFIRYNSLPSKGEEVPIDIRTIITGYIASYDSLNYWITRNAKANYIYSLEQPSIVVDRAAIPVFAAVPIKNNLVTYGPWCSHPGVIKDIVFPAFAGDDLSGITYINNLVGGVNVQIDDGLVPWEYGGMAYLDHAAMLRASDSNSYQQVLEYGSITLAGVMLRNTSIGQRLLGPMSPVITSVNVSIGSNGITTQYDMKTFSKKIGLYNKEQADNTQKFGRELLTQSQKFNSQMKELYSRLALLNKPVSFFPHNYAGGYMGTGFG